MITFVYFQYICNHELEFGKNKSDSAHEDVNVPTIQSNQGLPL